MGWIFLRGVHSPGVGTKNIENGQNYIFQHNNIWGYLVKIIEMAGFFGVSPFLLLLLSARIPLLRYGGNNPTFAIRLPASHLQENMIIECGGLNTASEHKGGF